MQQSRTKLARELLRNMYSLSSKTNRTASRIAEQWLTYNGNKQDKVDMNVFLSDTDCNIILHNVIEGQQRVTIGRWLEVCSN